MINSNFGPISHHFRDTATYSLKLSIKNCSQTAADGDMATIDSLWEVDSALSDSTIADSYTAYRLATISHDWHWCVVTLQDHPKSMIFVILKVNMPLSISDQ